MSVFVDTNILLYSLSLAPDEQGKREVAEQLLDTQACVLSVQVLNEFFHQATRPNRRDPMPRDLAMAFVDTWRRFPVVSVDMALVDGAREVLAQTNYGWWDCLIIAAARTAGCDTLASEDLRDGHITGGVRIVNPFGKL